MNQMGKWVNQRGWAAWTPANSWMDSRKKKSERKTEQTLGAEIPGIKLKESYMWDWVNTRKSWKPKFQERLTWFILHKWGCMNPRKWTKLELGWIGQTRSCITSRDKTRRIWIVALNESMEWDQTNHQSKNRSGKWIWVNLWFETGWIPENAMCIS